MARTKLEIDKLIAPEIDIDSHLAELDEMVAVIERMASQLEENPSALYRLQALRDFVYQPGWWNDSRPFIYDLDDPFGQVLQNKLLHDYMNDRSGNCVSMPLLFLFLGERLGLNMQAASAPLHIYIEFTDDEGRNWNLETTSGAGATRDAWYRQELPMSDKAVAEGVYMRGLDHMETVALMASVLIEWLDEQGRYEDAIFVSNLILRHHPRFTYAMVKQGTMYYRMLQRDFHSKYPTAQDVPQHLHGTLMRYQRGNQRMFAKAEEFGWRFMTLPTEN